MTTGISGAETLDAIEQELDAMVQLDRYMTPAAREVDAHLASTIAAGTDPSGKAWADKKDGGKALRNAHDAVSVRPAGESIVVELKGVEVFHHYGAQGKPVRTVIPKEMDEKLGNAIRRGVVTGWNRENRGRK